MSDQRHDEVERERLHEEGFALLRLSHPVAVEVAAAMAGHMIGMRARLVEAEEVVRLLYEGETEGALALARRHLRLYPMAARNSAQAVEAQEEVFG